MIPGAFVSICKDAGTGTAATGGFAGSTVMYGARIGVAPGVFTNEAGLGSVPSAHASVDNDHPARQGLGGSFEVFVDTIVRCTVTALVILTSGLWKANPLLDGTVLSTTAFNNAFQGSGYVVSIGLVLFAFATMIAWYYYGEKCVEYPVGQTGIHVYRVVYVITIYIGCGANLEVVWSLADFFNGLLVIPNLMVFLILVPVVATVSKDFWKDPHRIRSADEDFSRLLTYASDTKPPRWA